MIARIIAAVKRWRGSEPVRLFVWPLIGVVAVALITDGFVSADLVNIVLGGLAVVLGVPAVEFGARAAITPPATLNTTITSVVADVLGQAQNAVLRQIKAGVPDVNSIVDTFHDIAEHAIPGLNFTLPLVPYRDSAAGERVVPPPLSPEAEQGQ